MEQGKGLLGSRTEHRQACGSTCFSKQWQKQEYINMMYAKKFVRKADYRKDRLVTKVPCNGEEIGETS